MKEGQLPQRPLVITLHQYEKSKSQLGDNIRKHVILHFEI